MTVIPGTLDFTCYQGAEFREALNWTDADGNQIDLTGYTARMQVRKSVTAEAVELELTTANGRIVLAPVVGPPPYNILLVVAASVTAALEATPFDRKWRYDLELVPAGGQVRRTLKGKFVVDLEVTR
jgi:hypothetical protein